MLCSFITQHSRSSPQAAGGKCWLFCFKAFATEPRYAKFQPRNHALLFSRDAACPVGLCKRQCVNVGRKEKPQMHVQSMIAEKQLEAAFYRGKTRRASHLPGMGNSQGRKKKKTILASLVVGWRAKKTLTLCH